MSIFRQPRDEAITRICPGLRPGGRSQSPSASASRPDRTRLHPGCNQTGNYVYVRLLLGACGHLPNFECPCVFAIFRRLCKKPMRPRRPGTASLRAKCSSGQRRPTGEACGHDDASGGQTRTPRSGPFTGSYRWIPPPTKPPEALRAIFNYGLRDEGRRWALTSNPVALTDKRRTHYVSGRGGAKTHRPRAASIGAATATSPPASPRHSPRARMPCKPGQSTTHPYRSRKPVWAVPSIEGSNPSLSACDVSGHRSHMSRDMGLIWGSSASGRALCFGCASRSCRARSGGGRALRRW